MNRYTPSGIKFKIFVKEQDTIPKTSSSQNLNKFMTVSPLTGQNAKEFYEELINQTFPSQKVANNISVPKITKPKVKKSKLFKNSDLLLMAQNNDVKSLEEFFSQNTNIDVNIVDDFGWTPLMCAACSGAEEAVKLLLENSADPNKCDKLGNTALKLAKQKNKQNIVEILENWNQSETDEEVEDDCSEQIFFCPLCKEEVSVSEKKHESSTLHLFNCKHKAPTYYGIPESNKGFQLLLKEGWDKEQGLGPDGTGRKFPVKAVMKKDRSGIGAPYNLNQSGRKDANLTARCENKRMNSYKRWKEKDFEKNFRLEFS